MPLPNISSQSAANSAAQGGQIGASSSTRSIGGVSFSRGVPTWVIVGGMLAAVAIYWFTKRKG